MEKILNRHVFIFNSHDNGGEQLVLTTDFYDNGDAAHGLPNGIITNQRLTLQSYCNSATFELGCSCALTPELLIKLATELMEAKSKALAAVEKAKMEPRIIPQPPPGKIERT